MTRVEVLRNCYDREMNNVFVMSANYLMNSAKPGYEKPWQEAREAASILEELIRENGGAV